MKICINRGNKQTAKSYPYWEQLLLLLKNHEVKEIEGILSTQELKDIVDWCDTWITIDSFLPHFCAYYKLKKGIVIWGKSDPELFGYKHNINLLKGKVYLRKDQYRKWDDVVYDKSVFVSPQAVAKAFDTMI